MPESVRRLGRARRRRPARARRRWEGSTRGRTTRHGPVDVAERRARDPAIGQAVLCLVAGRSASRAREVRKALGAATGATVGALASAGEATARSGTRAWALLSGCWNGPRPCPGPEAQDALDRADAHNGHARRPHRVRDGAAVRVPRRAPQSCARPLAAQLPWRPSSQAAHPISSNSKRFPRPAGIPPLPAQATPPAGGCLPPP